MHKCATQEDLYCSTKADYIKIFIPCNIKNKFPKADLRVFDFYDADRHAEPAIIRARKVSLVYPNTQVIPSNSIPMEDSSVDLVFLLSAVHEIRSNEEKVHFLKECRRVCKPDGQVVMIEHLRDFPNFLAFSVGFTHFFPAGFGGRLLAGPVSRLLVKESLRLLCLCFIAGLNLMLYFFYQWNFILKLLACY